MSEEKPIVRGTFICKQCGGARKMTTIPGIDGLTRVVQMPFSLTTPVEVCESCDTWLNEGEPE